MLTELATGDQADCLVSPASKGRPLEDSSGLPRSGGLHLSSHPRLRDDLIFSHQIVNESVVVIVKDPVRGEFFRFKEPEYFIARQLDGSTLPEAVCQRVEERFGARLEPETLEKFVKTLRRSRLLEGREGEILPQRGSPRRIQGNLFYLRFKVCDPDRLFNRLIGAVRFCFTPSFVAFSAIVIFMGISVLAFNWEKFKGDLPQLYHWTSIPMIWVIILLVTTVHEFGHGLTCKHFGGEVHELGFLLIYFQPALYCNVSDAWLFPEKARRLWVSFAGPYLELFLWALAALAWRLADAETHLHYVALAVTATSGVKTLLNFNPLIKMDGYYLLSDYLNIPNLRRRSYACIGSGIKRLFGTRELEPWEPRERRIFLVYGLVASVFSFWFLGFMALKLGNYLVERNQGPLGLLLLLFLFYSKIRRRFVRLFPQETKAGLNAVKKRIRSMKRPAIGFTLLTLVLAGLFFIRTELKVTGSFRVLPLHNADVRSGVEGIIEQIYVDEGNPVQKGELIARLSDRDNLAELHKTEAAIEAARAQLRLLEAGPRREEIEVARVGVSTAAEAIPFATSRLGRNKTLYEENLVSKQELEDSEANLADRKNGLAEAKSKLDVLLAGSRQEEIDAIKAEIVRLNTQKRYLEEQIQLVRIVSPATGMVATPSRQLKEMTGKLVKKGDLIAKVFDVNTIEAEASVSEKEIADVKIGQTFALRVRAYPDRTFYGKVASIATTTAQAGLEGTEASAPSIEESKGKTIRVTTRIDNSSLLLKPGMTGNAKIFCGRQRPIDLITRRLARTFKVEFWSWW